MEPNPGCLHNGVAIGVARGSPPPREVQRLFTVRMHPVQTYDLAALPRPAIVVGDMPCERFASAVSAEPDVAYVAVGFDPEALGEKREWVDAVVLRPSDHHQICAVGERALELKQKHHEPRPILSEERFAYRGRVAELSPLEARILHRLMQANGAVVPKRVLAYELWGNFVDDPGRAVEAHIYRIRKRLCDVPGVSIVTERQRGFRLRVDH